MSESLEIIQLLKGMNLYERVAKATLAKIEKYFDECSKNYFSEFMDSKPTRPTFSVETMQGKGGVYGPTANAMVIHPNVTTDDTLLRRIVFHETIHYWDHQVSTMDDPLRTMKNGHGYFFEKYMKQINANEGKDFITVQEPSSSIKTTSRKFYVYFAHNASLGIIYYFWANKNQEKEPRFQRKLKILRDFTKAETMYILPTKEAILQKRLSLKPTAKKVYHTISKKGTPEYELMVNSNDKILLT